MKAYVSTIIEKDNKFLLVKEETNLDVELDGLVSIYNNWFEGFYSVSFIFSSKVLKWNKFLFDKNEIQEVKWFSFEEINNMKEELRDKDYIINSIEKYKNKDIKPLEIIITR